MSDATTAALLSPVAPDGDWAAGSTGGLVLRGSVPVPGPTVDGLDAAVEELVTEVADTSPEVLGEDPVDPVGPDEDNDDDDEPDPSAHATPLPLPTATPTPNATASAPTRPM